VPTGSDGVEEGGGGLEKGKGPRLSYSAGLLCGDVVDENTALDLLPYSTHTCEPNLYNRPKSC
jgi:hypothetical protein